jgi:hypothetical protein
MAARSTALPQRPKSKDLPQEEAIRQRAYEIYQERGGQDGSDVDDWLQAQEEIVGHDSTDE